MSKAFGSEYAEGYDLMYEEKNYSSECDLLERIWTRAGKKVKSVLDLGCGTGAHSLELARRGYEVTGVDRSPEMVAIARRKTEEAGVNGIDLVVSDIADFDCGRTFDAAIMMFNVIGYLADRDQRVAALANIRRHLEDRNPFVFDFWYGPAVLRDRPIQTFREIPTEKGQLLRASSTHLDAEAQVCDIKITVWNIEGDRVANRASEHHRVRFFFRDELTTSLAECDLELLETLSFNDPERPASDEEWDALGICRATGGTAAT